MIHPQDMETLQRILGEEIPANVKEEVELRTSMFHSSAQGPMGVLALIEAVRFSGVAPPKRPDKQEVIDWRRFPQDGSVRVEAKVFDEWQPGVFRGFVAGGTLGVLLDGDKMVREVRKYEMRLPTKTDTVSVAVPQQAVSRLPEPPSSVPPAEATVEPAEVAQPEVNWRTVKGGAKVWVEDGDDVKDAEFIGVEFYKGSDHLRVQVDGETKACRLDPKKVRLAS